MMPQVISGGWTAPAYHPPHTRTVLIAEDDAAIRDMLRIILESEGFHIDVFSSGNQVLAQLATAQSVPYVLILDLQMADGNGLCVLQWLAEHPRQASQAVVIVATAQTAPLPQWSQTLVQTLLLKPYDIEILIRNVAQGTAT